MCVISYMVDYDVAKQAWRPGSAAERLPGAARDERKSGGGAFAAWLMTASRHRALGSGMGW